MSDPQPEADPLRAAIVARRRRLAQATGAPDRRPRLDTEVRALWEATGPTGIGATIDPDPTMGPDRPERVTITCGDADGQRRLAEWAHRIGSDPGYSHLLIGVDVRPLPRVVVGIERAP